MELDVAFNLDLGALISSLPSASFCWAMSLWGTIAFDPTFGSFTLLEPVSN